MTSTCVIALAVLAARAFELLLVPHIGQARHAVRVTRDAAEPHYFSQAVAKRQAPVPSAGGQWPYDRRGQAYLVLPEFYEWFHRDSFAYHSSTIAEYLNNLRLGIFAYLQPEFARAYHEVEPRPMYRFNIPTAITHPLAKEMYGDLMNMVRARPYMPRFEVSQYVKMRY